ncbi:MAG: hypothetical protein EF813_02835 [Methanosarcinales archaeon]|nr:MAG: hypothetical protein EF813_02835 [Methanosarcinales archaeon]
MNSNIRKRNTALLAALMVVSVLAVMPTATAAPDDYFIYGNTAVSGYAVDGYELNETAGLLYVDNSGTCYIYQVSIPEGADPNMHPNNPDATGPMAPRTFTPVGSHNFRGDCGWSRSHHAEFYVDADHDCIYYGAYSGIEKWSRNADGSFGAYLGKVSDKNGNAIIGNGDETFAYDVDNNVWYSCSRNRVVHSFDADVDTAWQNEFTYPDYGGNHHDGMEFVNGYLWISDMTSDYIGQWEYTGTGPHNGWREVNRFSYSYGQHVEGMGFEPLGHFWVTSGTKLYELGGGRLQQEIEGIPDQCILAGESFEMFDLDDYTTGDVDHYGYSGNVDLSVSIDADNVVMLTYPVGWTGSETITFIAYDADDEVIDIDDATFTVCPVPIVGDIPDQTAPFESFDLDDCLDLVIPVDWSALYACGGWTVDIDADNIVTVTAPDGATDPCTITFTATTSCCGREASDSDDATFIPNQPPNVTDAYPSTDCLWPPNHKFVDITIEGVTDPDGDLIAITVTGITSDEPTASIDGAGGEDKAPDASGVGTDTTSLRAERSGDKDGRVYEITFLASDGIAETEGSVFVKVPHDQSSDCVSIDSGQNYDATEAN